VFAQPLSPPLQRSLRFFHIPVPTPLSASLAGHFPVTGFPCFVSCPSGLGPSLSAGSLCVHDRRTRTSCTGSVPFGQACQHLWLVGRHDVYQDARLCCPYHSILAPNCVDARSPIVLSRCAMAAFRLWLRCPRSFTPSDYSGRVSQVGILLVKQQVSSRLSSLRQTLERLHVAPS
jgi:hypothetical protein